MICRSQQKALVGLVVFLMTFLFGFIRIANFGFFEDFPSQMLTLSISLAAATLTMISIVTALPLSQANRRIRNKSRLLRGYVSRLRDRIATRFARRRDMYGRELTASEANSAIELNQKAIEQIEQELLRTNPLSYNIREGLSASCVLICSSVSSAIGVYQETEPDLTMLFTLLTYSLFSMGLALFSTYLFNILQDIREIQRVSRSVARVWGRLRVYQIVADTRRLVFDPDQNEDALVRVDVGNLRMLRLLVEFEGRVVNGFFDAYMTLSNETTISIWVPDRNTFLSEFGHEHGLRLVYLEPDYYTGMLQGVCTFEDTKLLLEYPLRTLHRPRRRRFGVVTLSHPWYEIPEDLAIRRISLRVYEDPLYFPEEEEDSLRAWT